MSKKDKKRIKKILSFIHTLFLDIVSVRIKTPNSMKIRSEFHFPMGGMSGMGGTYDSIGGKHSQKGTFMCTLILKPNGFNEEFFYDLQIQNISFEESKLRWFHNITRYRYADQPQSMDYVTKKLLRSSNNK